MKKDRVLSQTTSGNRGNLKAYDAPRVEITEALLDRLFTGGLKGEVSDLSVHTGLPYSLIYNLVRGRIHSLSPAEYRRIFGEAPPLQEQQRVKGEYFRGMVRLWMFLNKESTEKDLYRELHLGRRSVKKADYRIFSGATKTVEARLEKAMEQKFLSQGLDRSEIIRWILDLDRSRRQERVPYEEAKPLLQFLHESLGIHPSHLLDRGIGLYEKGQLKSISRRRYDDLLMLKEKTEKALAAQSRLELERLKEGVYGGRKNLVLFSEVEEDLNFLRTWAGVSPKKYLGRSAGKYRRSLLKRVASWRAEKIRQECDRAVLKDVGIPLISLPRRHLEVKMQILGAVLKSIIFERMIADKSLEFERLVMSSTYHSNAEFESGGHGYVTLQEAANFLGMKQGAFDLLVAAHRDIFTRIMRYEAKWLIPEAYLEELSQNRGFPLVKGKYELLARRLARGRRTTPSRHPQQGDHGRHDPDAGSGTELPPHRTLAYMASYIAN
jgi:hypothetical protein